MILAPTLLLNAGSGAAIARPTFSRDFAGEKTLNNGTGPAITFTRGTNATYFDATGTLRFAPNNHIRNSQAGGSTNGVIGSGGALPTNWERNAATGIAYEVISSGSSSGLNYVDIKISGTNTSGSTGFIIVRFDPSNHVTGSSSQSWTGSFYAALVGGSSSGFTQGPQVMLQGSTAAAAFVESSQTNLSLTSSLVRYSQTRTLSGATTERVNVQFYGTVANGDSIDLTLRIAAPQLELGSTATDYNPTTGTAFFGPRFDHSGGSSLGLLIEEARTNLLERSEEFDNAYWTKNNCTISSNATAAPTGGQTADTLFDTSGSAARSLQKGSVTVTTSTAYTITAFAKDAGRRYFHIRSNDNTTNDNGADVVFDLQNGLVSGSATARGTWSAASADIASVGSGWYRCRLTTTVATTLLFVKFQTSETGSRGADGNAGAYTGDITKGIHIWGAQLEAGAFATSYIPTTTAAATRAADSAVVTPISSFYNQSEGTLFAEASSFSSAANASSVALTAGGSADERIQLRVRGSAVSIVAAAATSFVSSSADPAANVANKRAAAAKLNDFAVSTNGGAAETDTAGDMPSVTHLVAGALSTGLTQPLNGHIRKIAYWPRRLSNSLLQQLTT
jgi:hypothetical protein